MAGYNPLQYQDSGTTGPLGAFLSGQEDTYAKNRRAYDVEQANIKQAADIAAQEESKKAYAAQVAAQADSAATNKLFREQQIKQMQQQDQDRQRQQAAAHLAVIADAYKQSPEVGMQAYNASRDQLPQDYRGILESTGQQGQYFDPITRQRILSGLNPQVLESLARNVDRTRSMTAGQTADIRANAQESQLDKRLEVDKYKAKLQSDTQLQIASMKRQVDALKAAKGGPEKLEAAQKDFAMKVLELQARRMQVQDGTPEAAAIDAQIAYNHASAQYIANQSAARLGAGQAAGLKDGEIVDKPTKTTMPVPLPQQVTPNAPRGASGTKENPIVIK